MALQELNSPPPVTGLGNLGAVLADAGNTYARNARQDVLIDRQTQLEDKRYARGRTDQLADVASSRAYDLTREQRQMQEHVSAMLINEGLLAPGEANNPDAVAKAWAVAQSRGLEKLYEEMMVTPGPNGPLLSPADINNPQKVAKAKEDLGRIKSDRAKFAMGQQGNAQNTVNNIQGQLEQVRSRSAAVAASIDSAPPQLNPGDQKVLALAAQMAEQNKAGSGRNREAVAAMAPLALKQLNEQAFIQHMQKVQGATRELEALRYNEAQLTNALRETIQTFKVAPSAPPPSSVIQPTTSAPAPKAATAQDVAGALEKLLGGGKVAAAPAPQAPAPNPLLPNTGNDPIVAQENTRRTAQTWQETAADPFNKAMDEVASIDQMLAAARRGTPPPTGLTLDPTVPMMPSPQNQAEEISSLLIKKEAATKRAEAARRVMLGLPPDGITKPVNTAVASQPASPFILANPVIPNMSQARQPAAQAGAWWAPPSLVPAGM